MNGNGKNPDFLRTNISFNSGMADYRATTPTNFAALGIKTPNHTQMQPSQMSSQQSERFYNHYQREEIAEKLTKRLAPECISQRPAPGGGKVSYIEGTQAIALANSIFGYDGWSNQIMSNTTEYLEPTPHGKFNCCISTVVRVTVLSTGAFHEDVGIGEIVNCPSRASAIDKCRKEAVTDAVKRCLRYFGNSTGNCLYDKDYSKEIIKHKDRTKYRYDPDQLYRPPESDYRPSHVREQEAMRLTQQKQQQQQHQHQQQVARKMSGLSNGNSSTVHPAKEDDLIWDGFEMNDASVVSMLDDKLVADVTIGSNGVNGAGTDRDNKSSLMPPPAVPNNQQQPSLPPQQVQQQQHHHHHHSPVSSPKKNKGAESRAAALKRGRESTMVAENSEQPTNASTLKKSKN